MTLVVTPGALLLWTTTWKLALVGPPAELLSVNEMGNDPTELNVPESRPELPKLTPLGILVEANDEAKLFDDSWMEKGVPCLM